MPIFCERSGDIFRSECQVLTVPVNTVGVMGKGLALAFKREYSHTDMFDEYVRLCREGELVVGRPCIYRNHCDRDVLLFPTKQHWKKPSRVEWIEEGLSYLVENHEELEIESISIPPLGCGLGQLDYLLDVKPLLVKYLKDVPFRVELIVPTNLRH